MLTLSSDETTPDAHTIASTESTRGEPELHVVELAFPTPSMIHRSIEEYGALCREQMEPILADLQHRFPGMTIEANPNMGAVYVKGTTEEIAQILQTTPNAKMLQWGIHRSTRIEIECALGKTQEKEAA